MPTTVKPDCDDSFVMLASELSRAIGLARFSSLARTVLDEVFIQIYGLRKLPTATINQSELARMLKTTQQVIFVVIKELVDSGVLIKVVSGRSIPVSYRFEKHYDRWTKEGPDGERVKRFTADDIACCQSAPAYVKALKGGPSVPFADASTPTFSTEDGPASIRSTPNGTPKANDIEAKLLADFPDRPDLMERLRKIRIDYTDAHWRKTLDAFYQRCREDPTKSTPAYLEGIAKDEAKDPAPPRKRETTSRYKKVVLTPEEREEIRNWKS